MKNKISQTELATLAGVSPQMIWHERQKGKLIRGGDGLYDMAEPKNSEWATRRGLAVAEAVPAGWELYPNLTLKQYVLQHHADKNFDPIFADILNKLLTAESRDVSIQEKRRQLIEKDFVVGHLIQFIDIMQNQLVNYPGSKIDEFIAEVKANEAKARIKIPEKMRKDISKATKESIKKTINNLRGKK